MSPPAASAVSHALTRIGKTVPKIPVLKTSSSRGALTQAAAIAAAAAPQPAATNQGMQPSTSYQALNQAATTHAASSKIPRTKSFHLPKVGQAVIGHRGTGSNKGPSSSTDEGYFAGDIRENTVLAFNQAARMGANYVELDVQVTKDGVPVVWHDDHIFFKEMDAGDAIKRHTISELTLAEFRELSFLATVCSQKPTVLLRSFTRHADGPQSAATATLKPWVCRQEDELPTLEEVLRKVPNTVGINLELKYEFDAIGMDDSEVARRLEIILACLERHCNASRKVVLSSFSPDACILAAQRQSAYPVLFLSDSGYYTYDDARRNSLEAAYELCKDHGLNGFVLYSFVQPSQDLLDRAKRDGLVILSYGEKNNEEDFSAEQVARGIRSVIVDDVREIHTRLSNNLTRSPSSVKITV